MVGCKSKSVEAPKLRIVLRLLRCFAEAALGLPGLLRFARDVVSEAEDFRGDLCRGFFDALADGAFFHDESGSHDLGNNLRQMVVFGVGLVINGLRIVRAKPAVLSIAVA